MTHPYRIPYITDPKRVELPLRFLHFAQLQQDVATQPSPSIVCPVRRQTVHL